jgi:hypothetical protein
MACQRPSSSGSALALACLCAAWLWACDKARELGPEGQREATAKALRVRCEDFMTRADITALGLKAEPYSEVTDAKTQAVRCSFGEVTAAIWRGDKYGSIVDGIDKHGKAAGIAAQEGPMIGVETQWTTMPPAPEADGKERHTLNFVPPNRKFTASVTGTDKSKVEQVAATLLARFQKM